MSRVRCAWVGAVAACAAMLSAVVAAPAVADDPPPDLSASTFNCRPENAVAPLLGSTRPGDFVICQLVAGIANDTIALQVTADVAIPDGTTFAPLPNAQGTPLPPPPGRATVVHFDETKLGLIDPGIPKPATVRLQIDDDAVAGAPIEPVATVKDPHAVPFPVTAKGLTVMPQIADLSDTTTTCGNADPARTDVRAGDVIACTFLLANKPHREDATDVSLTVGVPRMTAWTAGGNETFHFGSNLNWLPSALPGGVPSGGFGSPVLTTRLQTDPNILGGTVLYVTGTLNWTNRSSGVAGSFGIGSNPIPITPGPAVLTASALTCADDNGPPLLAGDIINCTVALRPAAGHEGVQDVAGSAALPALTSPVTSADTAGRMMLVGMTGAVAAGAEKAATYRIRVAPGAVQGNVIVPTAQLTGTSVPSGGAFTLPLQATPLIVGAKAVAQGPAAPARTSTAASVAAAATTAAGRDPLICSSKRTVTVNVKPPRGRHWKAVSFTFARKTVKGKKATGAQGKKGYFRAKLVFQGLPKGPLKVAITGTTTKGTKVKSSRTYNLCVPKKQ